MTGPAVAVLTLAHGRHGHLAAQLASLAAGTRLPERYVVAAIDDPLLNGVVRRSGAGTALAPVTQVLPVPSGPLGLPLAKARNLAAAAALEAGADVLVFLDVDCLASPDMVSRYAHAVWAVRRDPSAPGMHPGPAVFSGAVHYLPPRRPGGDYTADDLTASHPHPARPAPPAGQVVPAGDLMLFWSLSFAISGEDWARVGGFDEAYEGYGGEDTDFAMRLTACGGTLSWLGGAVAYHQHHPVADPPIGHLPDIVRNSNLFRARWGVFPMTGWLAGFEDRGFIRLSGSPPSWHLTPAGRRAARSG